MYTIVYETYLNIERQRQYEEIVNESIKDTFTSIGNAIGKGWEKFIKWLGKICKWIRDKWQWIKNKWKNRKKKKDNTSSEDVINNPTEYTPEEVKEAIYEEVEKVDGEIVDDDEFNSKKNKNGDDGGFSSFAKSHSERFSKAEDENMNKKINIIKSALDKVNNDVGEIIRKFDKKSASLEARFRCLLDDVKECISAYNDNNLDKLRRMKDLLLTEVTDFNLDGLNITYTLDDAFIAHNLSGGVSREEIKKYVDAYFKSKSNDIIKYLEQDITKCVNILNEIYDLLKDFKPTKNDEVLSLISELVRKNTIGLQNLLAALK